MTTAASLNVEVVVDLGNLDADLKKAEARTRSSATTIANDLGKVERAAEGATTSTGRAAAAVGGTAAKLEQAFGQAARAAMSGSLTMASLESSMLAASRATGPLGVAIIGLTVSYVRFGNEMARAEVAVAGIGRATGLTGRQLADLAKETAAAGGVSAVTAREMAFEYAKTGKIGPQVMRDLIRLTKDFAATTGDDAESAVRDLAKAFADPVKGADDLNKKLGFLDGATRSAIRLAVEQNDTYRAQRLLIDGIASSTQNAANLTTFWGRAWEFLKTKASNGIDAVGQAIDDMVDPSKAKRLADLDKQISDIQNQLANRTTGASRAAGTRVGVEREAARLDLLRRSIVAEMDIEKQRAEIGQRRVQNAAKTNAATGLLEGAQRDQLALQMLAKEISTYKAGLESAKTTREEVFASGLDGPVNKTAFAAANQQIRDYEAQLKVAEQRQKEYSAAVSAGSLESYKAAETQKVLAKAINDVTPAQKGQTASELARVAALGTAASEVERSAQAERARRDAMRDGAAAGAAASRATNDNIAGLTAEEQAIRQNGAAFAVAAKLREQARRETQATGGDYETRLNELLREELARVDKARVENNARLKETARFQADANNQVRAGTLSQADAARLVEQRTALERDANALRAAGVTDEKQIAAAVKETAAAMETKLSAEKEMQTLGLLATQKDSIALLQLEVSLLGKSAEERARALGVMKAEQTLRNQGIDPGSALGRQYIDGAKVEANLNATKERFVDFGKDLTTILGGAFDDIFTKTDKGFAGTIDNALKSFSKLGTRLIEQQILKPLLGGQGLGAIFGMTASNDNSSLIKPLTSGITSGAEKGVFDGIISGFKSFFGDPVQGPTANGMTLDSAGSSGLGGYGAGALAGFGIGYSSQSPIVGALGGALAGAAAGTAILPGIGTAIGALVGAIAGAGGGILGNSSAGKKAREEREAAAQENYKQAQPQILELGSKLRGDPQGTLAQRIAEAEQSARKLADITFFAGKSEEGFKLYREYLEYETRVRGEFAKAYPGFVSALEEGMGPDSPFSRSGDAVKLLGDQLKVFVDDTLTIFGEGSAEVERSKAAARSYALTVLEGSKELSSVATRLEEIRGAGTALQLVLTDLGMAASDAAAAIDKGIIAATARLKASFESELQSKINDATGKGFINDVSSLLKEVTALKADAASLGVPQGQVVEYLRAKAQEIVDAEQLTGAAFDSLLARFPELVGNVNEFTTSLKGAAREADIAARILNAQDRLFGATNDNSTLGGQLAAYNRQALREREAEIKAGSEALVDLEQAQAAERYNIVKAWNDKIVDDQKRAADEASAFWDRFSKQIREYTDGLRAGSESPLSPQARLAAAQSQYNAQLGLAQGGDRDALNGITSYSSDLLEAAKAYFASSTGYQDIFAGVIAQLEALPDQVSETQLIINAIDAGAQATVDMLAIMKSSLEVAVNSGSAQQIAAALSTYFNQIDSNTSGSIDFSEMQAALGGMASNSQLYSMFTRLDTDASGNLRQAELIETATRGTKTTLETGGTALLALAQISNNTDGTATQVSIGNGSLGRIDTSTAGIPEQIGQLGYLNDMWAQNDRIISNLASANNRFYAQGNSGAVQAYAEGGYTGAGGKYDPAGIVHKGEIVWSQSDISRFGGVSAVEALRTNDNFSMPAVAMPVMAGGGGQSNAALIAAIGRLEAKLADLEAEMARNTTVTAAAGEQVSAHVDGVTSAVKDGSRDKDLLAA